MPAGTYHRSAMARLTSTHVRQVAAGDLQVVTGILPGDNPALATHGHLLRIRFA